MTIDSTSFSAGIAHISVALRENELFSVLTDSELAFIVPIVRSHSYLAGELIIKQGDRPEGIYAILTGAVALLRQPEKQRDIETVVAILGPGEMLGLSAFMEPQIASLSSKALHDTNVLVVDSGQLKHLLEENHPMGHAVMTRVVHLLAKRLRQTFKALDQQI